MMKAEAEFVLTVRQASDYLHKHGCYAIASDAAQVWLWTAIATALEFPGQYHDTSVKYYR